MRPAAVLAASVLLASACARNSPPARAPATPASEPAPMPEAKQRAAQPAPEAEASGLPTGCSKSGDVCTPDAKWVDRLCAGSFPDVALYLFQKASPWTRGYLTRKTNAWNASGGASSNEMLEFDEEVLVLRSRAADAGGIQVSGAGGGYDALRWDGSCVTLAKEELTLRRPPMPKHAAIEWKYLAQPIRDALQADASVDGAYKKRQKECKGATIGTVSKACEKAHHELSKVIVGFVREGGKLPEPERLP